MLASAPAFTKPRKPSWSRVTTYTTAAKTSSPSATACIRRSRVRRTASAAVSVVAPEGRAGSRSRECHGGCHGCQNLSNAPMTRPAPHICCTKCPTPSVPCWLLPSAACWCVALPAGVGADALRPARARRESQRIHPGRGPERAPPREHADAHGAVRHARPASADLTMALRDLHLAKPALTGADRRTADRLLSRVDSGRQGAGSTRRPVAALLGALLRALRLRHQHALVGEDHAGHPGARVDRRGADDGPPAALGRRRRPRPTTTTPTTGSTSSSRTWVARATTATARPTTRPGSSQVLGVLRARRRLRPPPVRRRAAELAARHRGPRVLPRDPVRRRRHRGHAGSWRDRRPGRRTSSTTTSTTTTSTSARARSGSRASPSTTPAASSPTARSSSSATRRNGAAPSSYASSGTTPSAPHARSPPSTP